MKPSVEKAGTTTIAANCAADPKRSSDSKIASKVLERSSTRDPSPSSRGKPSAAALREIGKDNKEKAVESSPLSKHNGDGGVVSSSKMEKEKADESSLLSKHNEPVDGKASASKTASAALSDNAGEGNGNGKTKGAKPKRGVGRPPGRPPKHAQKRSSQKEMSVNQPRKRGRR
jgi:hypothetical protein